MTSQRSRLERIAQRVAPLGSIEHDADVNGQLLQLGGELFRKYGEDRAYGMMVEVMGPDIAEMFAEEVRRWDHEVTKG